MEYVKRAFGELISGRTWRELAYLTISAPLAVISFVFLIASTSIGAFLVVTLFGIPMLALVPLGARLFGEGQRRIANSVLGETIDKPAQFTPRPGFFGWLRSAFLYVDGWRSIGYLVLRFPLTSISFWMTVVLLAQGVSMALYPAWWSMFSPKNTDVHGVVHTSGVQFGEFYFDSWPKALLLMVFGIVLLLIVPWVLRGFVMLDRILMRTLLGGTNLTERVRTLEKSRAHAVEDSASTLRRVERDLHDGAQARLVAVAMNLGEIKDHLVNDALADVDAERVRELVDSAHNNAKEAITELRDVVRGIHPPVLDSGLAAAFETLASRSTIPVDVHVQLPDRPGVAVESIAYFCVAELLANVAKHSGARRAAIDVAERDGRLHVQVTDDGTGGARVGAGSGLTGLTNRVETVDGRIDVNSPHGGPTVIAIDLPMRN